MKKWLVLVLGFLLCCPALMAAEESRDAKPGNERAALASTFNHPPADSRILKIIHNWPDDFQAQTNLIQKLQGQGFGGVVCNVSFDQYLTSESKWAAFQNAVQAARQAGMALWLYDERGYPSGNAGGLVLKDHPEWQSRGLLIADKKTGAGEVVLNLPPGKLCLAAAYPLKNGKAQRNQKVDLNGMIQNRQLRWNAPAGQWHVVAITEDFLFEGTHAALNLAYVMPYVNLLQPEPTARFLQLTHQAYADRLGANLGREFESTFTDEPSLMSVFLRPTPNRVLPWADNLRAEFEKRTGRPYQELVPALVVEMGAESEKVRWQFWNTVGDLVSQNYFGQIQQWCARHQIPSGGHLLMEEDAAGHTGLYGNFFQCLRRLDVPSIDCLTSVPHEVPWRIARLASSAAELEGKPIVMCETSDHVQVYRPKGDARPRRTVSEDEIRGTMNRLFVRGIDVITSYYSFTGLDDNALARLNEYAGRICSTMKGGHLVADIAMVYPAESLWVHHIPARFGSSDSPVVAEIDQVFRTASDSLYAAGRDFMYIDSRTLVEARVEKGWLVHGPSRWRVIVLPAVDTMPLKAWQNLDRFARSGGVVLSLARLPRNDSADFPSSKVLSIGKRLFGDASGKPHQTNCRNGGMGIYLPGAFVGSMDRVLEPVLEMDVTTTPGRSPIKWTHRAIGGNDYFLLVNDSAEPWSGKVSFSAQGAGDLWFPMTGAHTRIDSGADVDLQLPAYGSVIGQFSKAVTPSRKAVKTSLLPVIEYQSLPSVKPAVMQGEFVKSELLSGTFGKTNTAWIARGTLKKSDVDTFLFAGFNHDQPLDLSGKDMLVLRASAPEMQSCSQKLLVVLREEGGAEYLTSTGWALSGSNREEIAIPFSSFELAGWSKDANGKLDLSRIKEIRVGWGGYYGKEGEVIEFKMDEPRVSQVSWPK